MEMVGSQTESTLRLLTEKPAKLRLNELCYNFDLFGKNPNGTYGGKLFQDNIFQSFNRGNIMKRIIIAAISIFFVVILCACSLIQPNSVNNPTESSPTQPNLVNDPTESSPTSVNTATAEPTVQIDIDDPEIKRAVDYGFVPEELLGNWTATITFSQYCTMIKNMLALYDENLVPQWEKTAADALASDDPMQREYGILTSYYAATLMGLGHTTNGNWRYLDEALHIDADTFFDANYTKWFPDNQEPTGFYDNAARKHISGWDYGGSSRFWAMGQTSPVSGKLLFDIDYDQKSNRPYDKFTRQEAIWSVLRLYESRFKAVDALSASDPKSLEILNQAGARREAILNSPTGIVKSDTLIQGKTYTGTAYYVAVDGDDSKDGKSPETAWATMNKVNSVKLAYGDAVFFKRGDTWYDQLWGQSGVSYSAYGTGPKPVISGSVEENAATADKWSLFYSGDNGEKVWVYYRDLGDITGVFFNGGKSWANKVYPFWGNSQYVFETGEPFDATNGLTNDLDFFSAVDLTKIDPFKGLNDTDVSGPLYLRSDAGNPGEIYENIDFSQDGTGISPVRYNGKDMTVDNFHIEYFGMLGISVAGYQGWTHTLMQNNEIDWCGGGITLYNAINDKVAYADTSGGAIQMSGLSNTAINNYIHHNANKTFVLAIHNRESASFIYSDELIKGNLLEYNATSLHLANYMEDEKPDVPSGYKNMKFEDNLVLYTGYGWVGTKDERTDYYEKNQMHVSAMECGGNFRNENEGIYITDNVFYLAKHVLVFCNMHAENQPVFSGNVYVQNEYGWLAMLRGRLLSVTENGEDYVKNELKDATGTVFSIK
jgi:hypothetical protein